MANELTNQDLLLAECLIKVAAIEKLLVSKGAFTSDELLVAMQTIAEEVAKVITQQQQTIDEAKSKSS